MNNIELVGNEISHTASSGIMVKRPDGSTNVVANLTIRSNKISNVCRGGLNEAISLTRVDGFTIAKNEILDDWKEGIDAKVGSKNGTIKKNYVHSMVDKTNLSAFPEEKHLNGGLQTWKNVSAGIYVDGFSDTAEAVTIDGNIIHDRGDGIAIGSESTGGLTRDISVQNNILYDVNKGVFLTSPNPDSSTTVGDDIYGIDITNNYIYTKNRNQWAVSLQRDAGAISVRNNILGTDDNSTGSNSLFVSTGNSVTIRENYFDGTTSGELGINPMYSGIAYVGGLTNLYGWMVKNVALQGSSVGVDVPTIVAPSLKAVDGTHRPGGGYYYDIGPYETTSP